MRFCALLMAIAAATAVADLEVVGSFDCPDTGITGLAFAEGDLYAVSSESETVYRMDPADGSVLDSFGVSESGVNGMGYAGDLLYLTVGSSNVYMYDLSGGAQGSATLYCSG